MSHAIEGTIEAEFIDVERETDLAPQTVNLGHIRRAPQGLAQPQNHARIAMDLDDWLDVDRKMHELYGLCEIAIIQRDQARQERDTRREAAIDSAAYAQQVEARLIEWKAYARQLESRLHQAQLDELQAKHQASKNADIAREALDLGWSARKRKKALAAKIED